MDKKGLQTQKITKIFLAREDDDEDEMKEARQETPSQTSQERILIKGAKIPIQPSPQRTGLLKETPYKPPSFYLFESNWD